MFANKMPVLTVYGVFIPTEMLRLNDVPNSKHVCLLWRREIAILVIKLTSSRCLGKVVDLIGMLSV